MPDAAPTAIGYLAFCRNVAEIPTEAMPDDDPGFTDSLFFAQRWVPCLLNSVDCYLYTLCVYNLGVNLILNYQQDQEGQTYFAGLRKAFKIGNFVAGVVSSAADQGTSTTLTVGDQLSNLSLADMEMTTNPFGQRALAIMGELGPAPWGLN